MKTLGKQIWVGLLILVLILVLVPVVSGPSSHARRPVVPRGLGDIELVCGGRACQEVAGRGQRWVVGAMGERYSLALVNRSDLWLEAVVTVDGRSILDGERRSSRSRGYLIPPRERVVVDGWRVSRDSVAAFRFTSAGDAYASRVGDRSELGVVRVDFYPERAREVWVPRPMPSPHPWEGRHDRFEEGGERPRASASKGLPAWDRDNRQGLGTQFGERRHQSISERDFERASSTPSQTLVVRYDDRAGLIARGVLPGRTWREDGPWVRPPPGWD